MESRGLRAVVVVRGEPKGQSVRALAGWRWVWVWAGDTVDGACVRAMPVEGEGEERRGGEGRRRDGGGGSSGGSMANEKEGGLEGCAQREV